MWSQSTLQRMSHPIKFIGAVKRNKKFKSLLPLNQQQNGSTP